LNFEKKTFGVIMIWSDRIGWGQKFGWSGRVIENGPMDVFDSCCFADRCGAAEYWKTLILICSWINSYFNKENVLLSNRTAKHFTKPMS